MKRLHVSALATMAVAAIVSVAPLATAGNGAPSGPHYNLNIIGHESQCPGDDLVGSNRHVIAVKLNFDDGSQAGTSPSTLDKTNKIFLAEGDFQVLDGNACDGDGAIFQLPANPFTGELDDPTFQEYEVYARALGQPGGSATITTCATDPGDDGLFDTADDVIVCSSENVVLVRNKGKSSFTRVTKELTTLLLDTDGDNIVDTRIGIFDPALQDYFWDYDNNGLRLAQLRFYPIPD